MTPRFRAWAIGSFILTNLILAAFPISTQLKGSGNKDYPLWYDVGQWVLHGEDLYLRNADDPFPFLYPPFAAIFLAIPSSLGKMGSVLVLVLLNAVSWYAAVRLSIRLVAGTERIHWTLWGWPSVVCLWGVYEMFFVGQPNLFLLALMLGGLVCLRENRGGWAGVLFALATAIKAFPIVVICYLLWRRYWLAAGSMVLGLIVFLVLVPAPIRGFERNLTDLQTWFEGMFLRHGDDGFSQRPEQALGWKNQSLLAVGHRFLRPVDADGDAVELGPPVRVNVLNLDFKQVTVVIAGIAALIGLAYLVAMPPMRRRTPDSDTAETAILISLMIIASPIAYTYYFVWLLYPVTLLIHHGMTGPDRTVRWVSWGTLTLTMLLLAIGTPNDRPHVIQAWGNAFWAIVVLVIGLTWLMRRTASRAASEGDLVEGLRASP